MTEKKTEKAKQSASPLEDNIFVQNLYKYEVACSILLSRLLGFTLKENANLLALLSCRYNSRNIIRARAIISSEALCREKKI